MPRCVVVCAGERGPVEYARQPGDFVVCCDGGLEAALALGLCPDLLVGDFDSLTVPPPEGIETLRFPVEKDDTDSMLALREGLARGYRDFLLLFSLGGRLDHTYANLQSLEFLLEADASGMLLGPRDAVYMLRDGTLTLPRDASSTLSVFAWKGDARGVWLRGVQYPLADATLTCSFPIGAGNHILEPVGSVTVEDGTLLVICSRID